MVRNMIRVQRGGTTRPNSIRNAEDCVPANLRELAKEAMVQTRGNYEPIEVAANEMMSVLVTQSTAAKSAVNYRAWLTKVAHGNVAAAFDFAQNLGTAKSVSDVIELSSAHARARIDALATRPRS
jgi:hypothetical protein